jgi:hypothetical protein
MVESDLLIGQTLQGIRTIAETDFTTDTTYYALVELIFQDYAIVLKPILETDEIEITQIPNSSMETPTPAWGIKFLQQRLQTFWVSENAQGYQDQVSFALGSKLHPNLMFIAEGSAIKVFQCSPVELGYSNHSAYALISH